MKTPIGNEICVSTDSRDFVISKSAGCLGNLSGPSELKEDFSWKVGEVQHAADGLADTKIRDEFVLCIFPTSAVFLITVLLMPLS